jgi:hypothetical protein
MKNPPVRSSLVAHLLVALLVATAGCSANKISRPDKWAVAEQPQRETVWTFLWGIYEQDVHPTNCLGPGLAEVTVRNNLGFSLISVVTLGAAMPITIEWRCAKDKPTGGDDF